MISSGALPTVLAAASQAVRGVGHVALDGGWLALEAPLADEPLPRGGYEPGLLAWNGLLTGGARFVLGTAPSTVRVAADIVLEPDVDVLGRVAEAREGIVAALALLRGKDAGQASLPPDAVADATGDLLRLCRESGWPARERDGERLAIDLDVPDAVHQAVIERRADGAVVAAAPVLDATMAVLAAPSARGARALAVLLLRAGGLLRIVRAAAPPDDVAAARFEVVQRRPSVPELAHSFAALSLACRLAAAEAAALWHDDALARAYLRDWDQARATRQKEDDDGRDSNDDDGAACERRDQPPDAARAGGSGELHDLGAAATPHGEARSRA